MSSQPPTPTREPTKLAAAYDRELREELRALTGRYPQIRGALLPILTRLQSERGHLTVEDLKLAAELTELSPAEVLSVTSFYTMYHLRPTGRIHLGVCRNISCWLCGSRDVLQTVTEELGVSPGQTTSDGRYSLEEVECLGSCGTGPVLEIESRYFENLTPERTRQLLAALREVDAATPDQTRQAIDSLHAKLQYHRKASSS